MARLFINIGCVVIALSLVSLVLAVPDAVEAGILHDPIVIKGDRDFTAANGVTGGSGTPEDPYVIEGWEISAADTPGIHITGTSSNLLIRNVSIVGSQATPVGVRGGVFLEHVANVEVTSVEVSMCWMGVFVYNSRDVNIEGCIAHDNGMGIRVTWSRGVGIVGNTVYSNWMNGIGIAASTSCRIDSNLMSNNMAGLVLQGSRSMSVSGNIFTQDGITISGTQRNEFDSHTITTDNLVSGLPIYYYAGVQSLRLEGLQAGEIIVAGCEGVQLVNLKMAGSSVGIEIAFCDFVNLVFCDFQNNHEGLFVVKSSSIDMRVCNFTGNDIGASIFSSESILVQDCRFEANLWEGLSAYLSADVRIGFSTFTTNEWALSLSECSNSHVAASNFTGNKQAVYLGYCTRVTIHGNVISYSTMMGYGLGMQIWGGKRIVIDQNDFIGNDVHVTVYEPGDITWNDEWSRGNYWDDYTGTDSDNDLTGDTPYMIDADNQDNYPHMVPYIW